MGWEENIQIQINVVLQLCSYQYYLVPGIWGGGGGIYLNIFMNNGTVMSFYQVTVSLSMIRTLLS
jgi:hypothetical protein